MLHSHLYLSLLSPPMMHTGPQCCMTQLTVYSVDTLQLTQICIMLTKMSEDMYFLSSLPFPACHQWLCTTVMKGQVGRVTDIGIECNQILPTERLVCLSACRWRCLLMKARWQRHNKSQKCYDNRSNSLLVLSAGFSKSTKKNLNPRSRQCYNQIHMVTRQL